MYYQNLLIFGRKRQKKNQLELWVTREKMIGFKIWELKYNCFQFYKLFFYLSFSGVSSFLGFGYVNKTKQRWSTDLISNVTDYSGESCLPACPTRPEAGWGRCLQGHQRLVIMWRPWPPRPLKVSHNVVAVTSRALKVSTNVEAVASKGAKG